MAITTYPESVDSETKLVATGLVRHFVEFLSQFF